jgi:hypothetical protein
LFFLQFEDTQKFELISVKNKIEPFKKSCLKSSKAILRVPLWKMNLQHTLLTKCVKEKLETMWVENKKRKQISTVLLNFKNAQWHNLETHKLKTKKKKKSLLHY